MPRFGRYEPPGRRYIRRQPVGYFQEVRNIVFTGDH